MSSSSAARTNLTSNDVVISNQKLGEGAFRIAMQGTYRGGNRNNQEAACKRFKPQWRSMANEYFQSDFKIADKAIEMAEEWNDMVEEDEKILITKGNIHTSNSGIQYLVEPLIRSYHKFTSNSGWIDTDGGWPSEAMEAFTHFTYHKSGGLLIVCDLQGRHRHDSYSKKKSRFELTDPAICSRTRNYGPTDLSEKGIDSFFANHQCNGFCNINQRWSRPRNPSQWFPSCSATSMFSSKDANKLKVHNRTQFTLGGMGAIVEEDDCYSSDDY